MNIKFATFNLFQFSAPPYSFYIKKDKFKEEEWSKKVKWIKEQLLKLDADIIGFQELFSIDELKKYVKILAMNTF